MGSPAQNARGIGVFFCSLCWVCMAFLRHLALASFRGLRCCGLRVGRSTQLPGLAITCQQPCSQRASFAFPTFACPSPCDVDAVIPGAMGQWRRALTGVPRDDVQSEARRHGEVQQQGRMRNVAQASGTGIRASGHQRLHPGTSSVSQPSLDRGGEPWAPASGCRSPGRGTECLSSALAGL